MHAFNLTVVTTKMIQGVRFDQQVELKARHCSLAAKVNYTVPDWVYENDLIQRCIKS